VGQRGPAPSGSLHRGLLDAGSVSHAPLLGYTRSTRRDYDATIRGAHMYIGIGGLIILIIILLLVFGRR
jgi:hypothetical protein